MSVFGEEPRQESPEAVISSDPVEPSTEETEEPEGGAEEPQMNDEHGSLIVVRVPVAA